MDEFPEEKPQAEVVQFYLRPVVDQEATLREGRTVHKEATYVKVSFPGDLTLEADRPIYDSDKQRWPRHWLAFQASKPQEVSGTMLSAWGPLSPALVEDYRAARVLTVEQLASVPDVHIQKLGIGAVGHRQAAIDFLEAAKSRAPLLRVQKELEETKAMLAAMSAHVTRAQPAAAAAPVAPVPEETPPPEVLTAAPKRRRTAKESR